MYQRLIQKYVNKLSKEDVDRFARQNNIYLSPRELELIYHHTKHDWKIVLYGDPTNLFSSLKEKLSHENYEKGIVLYQTYRDRYQDHL